MEKRSETLTMDYFFDFLPDHHKPIFPESLTGFLLSLAKGNDFSRRPQIARIYFPESDPDVIRNYRDLPPLHIETFARAINCSEDEILATTFYYLVEFFGKSTRPQVVGKFLSDATSKEFRFCPLCIKENRRYSLLWRFNDVTACHLHNCYLYNCCYSCSKQIPIFPSSLSFCECPYCGANFGDAVPQFIPEEERSELMIFCNDLMFLLSPKNITTDQNFSSNEVKIGKVLKYLRCEKDLQIEDISKRTDLSKKQILDIEFARIRDAQSKIRFSTFLAYARALKISFVEINDQFNAEGQPLNPIKKDRRKCLNIDEYRQRVTSVLNSPDPPTTLRELCKLADVDISRFFNDFELYQILPFANKNTLNRLRQRYEHSYKVVKKTIQSLNEKGEEVNFQTIISLTGIPHNLIYSNRRLSNLIKRSTTSMVRKENLIYGIDDSIKIPMFVRRLTEDERKHLEEGLCSTDIFTARRCKILLASNCGQRAKEIVQCLGCSHETVRRAIKAFNRHGIKAIDVRLYSSLYIHIAFSAIQEEQLKDMLNKSPRVYGKETDIWTLELAAEVSFSEGITQKRVSGVTIWNTLARLGIQWVQAKQWINNLKH